MIWKYHLFVSYCAQQLYALMWSSPACTLSPNMVSKFHLSEIICHNNRVKKCIQCASKDASFTKEITFFYHVFSFKELTVFVSHIKGKFGRKIDGIDFYWQIVLQNFSVRVMEGKRESALYGLALSYTLVIVLKIEHLFHDDTVTKYTCWVNEVCGQYSCSL